MNILAFDTSTECLGVAASRESENKKSTVELCHFGAFEHAEKIIPMIESALATAGFSLENCDAFVIGQGPGSFTGLRVGFATLQGIVRTTGKSCFGISGLDVTAYAGRNHEGVIAVVMDARREKVYLAIYESHGGEISRKGKYHCLTPGEAIKKLKPFVKKRLWITGDGLAKYGKLLQKSLGKALFAGKDFWYPHSLNLIKIYEERKTKLEPLVTSEFVPLYLQEPHIGPVKTRAHAQ